MAVSPAPEQQNQENMEENAEGVPEMVVSPALEQQNQVILGKMLKECRRWGYLRHQISRMKKYWGKC